MLRSTVETVSAPSDKDISWLNPRPHSPAVYASCATLPSPHATLATGRLARPYPGRTCTSRSNQLYVGAFLYPSYDSQPLHHPASPTMLCHPSRDRSERHEMTEGS